MFKEFELRGHVIKCNARDTNIYQSTTEPDSVVVLYNTEVIATIRYASEGFVIKSKNGIRLEGNTITIL